MSKIKIKICGLSRKEDIACVNELLPDFIGFNFYPPSKRYVTARQAAELKKILSPQIKAVGVFVNAEMDFILSLAAAGVIDMIQLHGDEDAAYCRKLKTLTRLPLIKAVRVRNEESLRGLENYPVCYFLFDAYAQGQYGGTGQRLAVPLKDKKITRPYFIAGGLDADNVLEILSEADAFAADVCGGVETDGVKDPQKIAAFIEKIRGDYK